MPPEADRPRGSKPSEPENHLDGDNTDSSRAGVRLYDLDAERAVIGAALGSTDGHQLFCAELTLDDFHRPAHRSIATVLIALHREDERADIVTVGDRLEREGTPVDRDILAEALVGCPVGTGAKLYARIVKDRSLRRKLIAAADDIANVAYSCFTADAALDEATDILAQLRADSRRPAP